MFIAYAEYLCVQFLPNASHMWGDMFRCVGLSGGNWSGSSRCIGVGRTAHAMTRPGGQRLDMHLSRIVVIMMSVVHRSAGPTATWVARRVTRGQGGGEPTMSSVVDDVFNMQV